MARLISRSEFALRCGVSKQAISKACGKQLAPACVSGSIDVDHEAARAYMAAKGVTLAAMASPVSAPTRPRKKGPRKPTTQTGPRRQSPKAPLAPPGPRPEGAPSGDDAPAPGSPEDLQELAAVLMPLVERFGTDQAFKYWLDALKEIELIREKRLKNAETEGRLISRELIKTHIFGAIEAANKRLLADSPRSIATQVMTLTRAGASFEEAERVVREAIAAQLKPVKTTAARNLRRSPNGKAQAD